MLLTQWQGQRHRVALRPIRTKPELSARCVPRSPQRAVSTREGARYRANCLPGPRESFKRDTVTHTWHLDNWKNRRGFPFRSTLSGIKRDLYFQFKCVCQLHCCGVVHVWYQRLWNVHGLLYITQIVLTWPSFIFTETDFENVKSTSSLWRSILNRYCYKL